MSPSFIKIFSSLLNEELGIEHVVNVTHTDLDGMASWVVLRKYYPLKLQAPIFSGYKHLPKVIKSLKRFKNSIIYITDLMVRPSPEILSSLEQVKNRGNKIYIIDHHSWKEHEIQLIASRVDELKIDTSHCGAMNTYKFLIEHGFPRDPCIERILKIVEDVDLWKLRYRKLSMRWHVVSSSKRVRKEKIVEKLYGCVLWDTELESIYSQEIAIINSFINKIINEINKYLINVRGIKMLMIKLPPEIEHQQTIISELLREKLQWKEIDVFVFVRKNGSLSFRLGTTEKQIDLSLLARKLGGGGHPKAAGARINYGILDKLKFRFTDEIPKLEQIIKLLQ